MTDDKMAENSSTKKKAASTGESVASDIKAAVSQKYDQTIAEARARAEDTKADVANEVEDVASALLDASEGLREGSAQERTLGQIAGGIADASDAIRDKDLGEIVQMANKLGRKNPVLFLGGAALLGFAASRYAKSSAENQTAYTSAKTANHKKEVDTFVSEGNPSSKPVQAKP